MEKLHIYKYFPSVSQIKQQQNEYRGEHVENDIVFVKGGGWRGGERLWDPQWKAKNNSMYLKLH